MLNRNWSENLVAEMSEIGIFKKRRQKNDRRFSFQLGIDGNGPISLLSICCLRAKSRAEIEAARKTWVY